MVEVLIVPKHDAEATIGTFITCAEYVDKIIDFDCDLYAEDPIDPTKTDEENIIFKYRKNVFTKEECDSAYTGLRAAAVESQNRGMAAGPRGEQLGQEGRGNRDWVTAENLELLEFLMVPENLKSMDDRTIESIKQRHKSSIAKDETRGQVWLRSEVTKRYTEYHGWFDKWLEGLHNMTPAEQIAEAKNIHDNYISDTNYAQSVMSGIAGYFDRYPRIPYGRATSYTEKHPEEFKLAYPYLRKLNQKFAELLPVRWAYQRKAADRLDPRFVIDETVFTTLTVNHNWRTACHRDAGDLHEGFSNICGITGPEGKGWKGAEFILPEFRVAINLQPGDMLLVNNHGGIHGNDALIGDDNDRLTLVSYFREKMLDLLSWDYENLRKQYIDERRQNKEHPLQRTLWNGVSTNMWEDQEWYDYMEAHGMKDPYGKPIAASLDAFF